MKKLRWQLLIIFLTGLVVGVLLLSEQPETELPVDSSPEPVQGGVYTEALIGSLMRLNPVLNFYNTADREVSRLIFSGLIRFDPNGTPQPDLAESWGVSKDGTLYNITIREDAVWHDGQPVTADDVLFTIDQMREGSDIVPADLQDFWKEIDVVKLDEKVLQFRLPAPFAPFPDYLSFGLLPKHLLDGNNIEGMIDLPFNIQPVGTGPYRFDRLLVDNGEIHGIALSAFPDYYGPKVYIEELVFRYYPDTPSALQAYRDGQVQGIGMVDAEILNDVLAEPRLASYTARQPELSMVMFNVKSQEAGFLQESEVRRALLLGLNRQYIVDRVLTGQAIVADGPILPGTWAYYQGLKHVEYDPETARAMLKDAGYVFAEEGDTIRKKGETELRLELIFPDDEEHQAVAEAIQANWLALGVDVQIQAVPYDLLLTERLEKRDFQAALVDLNLSRTPDPDPYPFWDQGQASSGQNYSQWDHKVASEYLEQARISVDLIERTKYYRNFQILFMQELPALPLYYPVYTYAVDREVQGIRVGPLFDTADRFANISEWFLAGRQVSDIAVAPSVQP
ncbi:MAG: peptide ABC transporter substrate-binding protein [Chloroflexi bacterium]|nr:peptide ABC transporter substrate-binding protein [Chloroflexota bacterium]